MSGSKLPKKATSLSDARSLVQLGRSDHEGLNAFLQEAAERVRTRQLETPSNAPLTANYGRNFVSYAKNFVNYNRNFVNYGRIGTVTAGGSHEQKSPTLPNGSPIPLSAEQVKAKK